VTQGRFNIKISKQAEGSVSAFYARALKDYLETIGIDPVNLFDPIFLAELNDGGERIPISHCQDAMERAIAYTNDLDLGLKVGEHLRPKHLGMFGFAAMSSQNLGDVVEMLVNYQLLIADINTVHLVQDEDRIELHWQPFRGPSTSFFMQQALACWITIARHLTSNFAMTCDVHFNFKQPTQLDVYQRIFGGAIYFDAAVTKLVFNKSVLDIPLIQSDPLTYDVLINQLNKTCQSMKQSTFLQKLRGYLSAHLAKNQVSIVEAAAAFGTAPRTLQYQLSNHGVSYRDFLEQVRQEQAEYYLRQTNYSLYEIALLLGYSEQSPFQNAFKRWTGTSPNEFRKSKDQ
jgi:AraC-like DNA-binding protein